MIPFAVVLSILILIALLRFGVSVGYSESGLIIKVQAGPLLLQALPRKEKPVSAKKEAKRKARKEEKARKKAEEKARKKAEKKAGKKAGKKTDEKKPGALKTVLELLPAVKTTLSRLRRRLLIKRLVIHYTVAGDDPFKVAQTYGAASAAIGPIVAVLESSFRIKRRDFRAIPDFFSAQQSIYINAAISLAVWEALYIVFAMLPTGIRIILRSAEHNKSEVRIQNSE